MLRGYTSLCLLLVASGCSDADVNEEAPFLYENKVPDAGPTNCSLDGTWHVTLGISDVCAPELPAATITLTVDGADSGDFTTAEPQPTSSCGEYSHVVKVAADSCTIDVSSLATWCSAGRSQCSDYQLTLHAHHDGTANVEGTYRRCWCGSPGAFGKKVEVAGSATLTSSSM
ncbi:MAG TPA: hypothetical protein VFN67_20200 [Polyangiales bacterium]|jgi:hypothetical protein|nr:hypothetical protein [Polyangiales bacterium]